MPLVVILLTRKWLKRLFYRRSIEIVLGRESHPTNYADYLDFLKSEMRFFLVVSLACLLNTSMVHAQRASDKQLTLTRAQIREAGRLLSEMGYWTGGVDGRLDP